MKLIDKFNEAVVKSNVEKFCLTKEQRLMFLERDNERLKYENKKLNLLVEQKDNELRSFMKEVNTVNTLNSDLIDQNSTLLEINKEMVEQRNNLVKQLDKAYSDLKVLEDAYLKRMELNVKENKQEVKLENGSGKVIDLKKSDKFDKEISIIEHRFNERYNTNTKSVELSKF